MNKRIERINELIKREVNKFILRNFEVPEGVLLTITKVETARDLSGAKIWFSIFPIGKTKNVFLDLKRKKGLIQRYLDKKLVMYPIPRVKLLTDTSEEKVTQIENLIDHLKD